MSSNSPVPPGLRFVFTIIFPGVFILAGAGIMYAGVKSLWHATASKEWPSVPGRVVSSEVRSHRGNKGGTTYGAEVRYDYEVNGTAYSADRVAFGSVNTSKPNDARQTVNKYRKDAAVTVYYAPKDPSLAVLEPGVQGATWFLPLFGSVFFLAGSVMAWGVPRIMGRNTSSQRGYRVAPDSRT